MQVPIYPGRGSWPDWNNPELLERNRLPSHVSLIPYPDQTSCRHALENHRRYLSPSVISLRGEWDFRFYASTLQLPENILSFRSGFEKRPLPEMAPVQPVLLDPPGLPFTLDPPHVPSEQPVLVYRRTCRLPLVWSSLRKRIVLHGVRSACHVFVNGKLAGYTQGSGLMADFDITMLLHDGDNEVFLIVYPYSCGSYLETQPNRPWYGCVHEITLEALPAITVHDLQLRTVWLAEAQAWRLDITALLTSCRIAVEQPVLHASLRQQDEALYDASWTVAMRPADPDVFAAPVQTTGLLQASLMVRDVKPWNDEEPNLYDLFVSLEDTRGRDILCVHQAVGFRSLDCRDRRLFVNGRAVSLKGVRWSGLDLPDPAQDIAGLVRTLRTYKNSHFNTIWFQHEPPDPIVLDLCDIYGFYAVVDAPLAAAGRDWIRPMRKIRPELPARWAEDRLKRLVARDKNHPCVVLWSCGLFLQPEQPDGSRQLAEHVRASDPTRYLHGLDIPDLGIRLDRWLNSQERLADLDWLGLPDPDAAGWCYLDHEENPDLLPALSQLLCPFRISPVNPIVGTFNLHNHMVWSAAGQIRLSWSLLRQGSAVLSGELDNLHAAPGQTQALSLWYGDQDFSDGAEYLVRFDLRQADDLLWRPAGKLIRSQEFMLQKSDQPVSAGTGHGGRLRLESERHHLIVSGPRFWLVFNRINASLESWRTGDREFFAARTSQGSQLSFLQRPALAGLRCSLMRLPEPTDGPDWPQWLNAGYDRLTTEVVALEDGCDGRSAVIELNAHLGAPGHTPAFALTQRYEIAAQGGIRLFASLTPLDGQILPPPLFGFAFNPARPYQNVSWYGCGPQRQLSRVDLRTGSGHHDLTLNHLLQPDREPGVFKDIRRLSLRDDNGFGLAVSSDHLCAFDVLPVALPGPFTAREAASDTSRAIVLVCHQGSLNCQPLTEPLKLVLDLTPVV
ncbi:MAG: hypothetical protein GX112_14260 [Clostridiaceae bacterium]|nr:hypothetical protein [Clostridiaceae bacterium]